MRQLLQPALLCTTPRAPQDGWPIHNRDTCMGKLLGDLKYAKVYHHIQVQTRSPYTEVNSLAHNISCTVLHELDNEKQKKSMQL